MQHNVQQAKSPMSLLCRLPLLLFDFPCCCCILFRADCSALLWLLLFSKSRPCPGRPWPFLAVSRFCQMTSLASPLMTSWGSASRQSAKQASRAVPLPGMAWYRYRLIGSRHVVHDSENMTHDSASLFFCTARALP